MDLKTFIAESLEQIVAGVSDAQSRIGNLGTNARINPALIAETAKKKSGDPSPVEFDIAVTVTRKMSESSTQGTSSSSGMISVVSAKASISEEADSSRSHRDQAFSRIRFTVQVAQPSDIETYSNHFASSGARDRSAGY